MTSLQDEKKKDQDQTLTDESDYNKFSTGIYSIRGIAAILILILHFGWWSAPWFNPNIVYNPNIAVRLFFGDGEIGVDFFAILSTLFLSISLLRKNENEISWSNWYKRRITRIFPMLWLTLAVILPTLLIIGNSLPNTLYYDASSIIINLSGLGGINGTLFLTYEWFIALILSCYLFFPLYFMALKKNFKLTSIITIVAFVACAIYFSPINLYVPVFLDWFGVVRYFEFFFGAIIGFWLANNNMENLKYLKKKIVGIFSAITLSLSLIIYWFFSSLTFHYAGQHFYERSVSFPIITISTIFLLVYIFMNRPGANRPFSYLGEINYEIYLMQAFPWEITIFVMFGLLTLPQYFAPIAFIIFILFDILLAYLWSHMGNFIAKKRELDNGIVILAGSFMIYAILEMIMRNFIDLRANFILTFIILGVIIGVLIGFYIYLTKYRKNKAL